MIQVAEMGFTGPSRGTRRVHALPHREEAAEVIQAPELLDASWVMCFRNDLLGGGTGADPVLGGEIVSQLT